MNTQIFNIENKINELVMRMDNAEQGLKASTSQEINALRNELQDLIKQFNEVKNQLSDENSEVKITQEIIDDILAMVDEYINQKSLRFSSASYCGNEIEDCDLRLNYSHEVELESVTINIGNYFIDKFYFDFNSFNNYFVNQEKDSQIELLKFVPEELFQLFNEIVEKEIANLDSVPNFCDIDDFECEIGYGKRIDVTDVTIEMDAFLEVFNDNFSFPQEDLEIAFKQFHNLTDSDDNSEEN